MERNRHGRRHHNWNDSKNQNNKNRNSNRNHETAPKAEKFHYVAHENEEMRLQKEKAIKELKSREIICPKCNERITDMASAICDKASGQPMHFECVMKMLESSETLGQNEKIAYIGQGRFAVLYYENIRDQRHFQIKKIIEKNIDLFEKYEEEIVVAAYQRFKTSDNLFNYREALLEGLDNCQDVYIEALAADYCKVERCAESEAIGAILSIIDRIRDDLTLMGELIAEIDKNHITYRQRAVQRAQFMLLTDGTTQGRINSLLRYYAKTLETPASLFDVDDSPLSKLWRIYPTEVLGRSYLKPPVTSRKPTPIEPLNQPDALDEQELRNAQQALLAYARSAVTMENVNTYAQRVLKSQAAVRASSLATEAGDDFVKIIALHTYSRSDSRSYEIELQDNWISMHGFRFQEFVVKRKV